MGRDERIHAYYVKKSEKWSRPSNRSYCSLEKGDDEGGCGGVEERDSCGIGQKKGYGAGWVSEQGLVVE